MRLPPKPSREELKETGEEYQKLYTREPPTGPPLEFPPQQFIIPDHPPDEEEVVTCLGLLRNNKCPGRSGIRMENLKAWHKGARPPKDDEGEFTVEPDEVSLRLWEAVL